LFYDLYLASICQSDPSADFVVMK